MTTHTTSTQIRHDSDANFRLWGAEFNAALAAIGLVQTADTGQINWATAVRAAANSNAGYEVWRYNDAAQSTAPIFVKVFYGTGSGSTSPRIQVQVGTGSDGAGNLTGVWFATTTVVAGQAATSATARTSYWSHARGGFAFWWKIGAGSAIERVFWMSRSCDHTGVPTDEAAVASTSASVNAVARRTFYRYASPAGIIRESTSTVTEVACSLNPLVPASSKVGSDDLVFFGAITDQAYGRVYPFAGACGVNGADVAVGTDFSVTNLFTSATITYKRVVNTSGPFGVGSLSNPGTLATCMIWE